MTSEQLEPYLMAGENTCIELKQLRIAFQQIRGDSQAVVIVVRVHTPQQGIRLVCGQNIANDIIPAKQQDASQAYSRHIVRIVVTQQPRAFQQLFV